MQMLENKSKISTIALILVLTFSAIFAVLPVAISQEPGTKQTFCILDMVPNPVGVNQEILLTYGITDFTVKPQMGADKFCENLCPFVLICG